VKPDIVFFGENLPARFFQQMVLDFPKCDLLIVMGTSLQVQPFASLVHRVHEAVPRLLINREMVGKLGKLERLLGMSNGFRFGETDNYRDVAHVGGDLQDGVQELVRLLGWQKDLDKLMMKNQ
jgi:NAD-dependent deacetylase sirtuin 2